MTMMICGLLVWSLVHFIPSLAPGVKEVWQAKLGASGYQGTFAVCVLAGLGLIVMGWRSAQPTPVYLPPEALRVPALGLMLVAFLLLAYTRAPGRIKRVVRHPQLTGVGIWGVAHLLLNGDSRSVVLFGAMSLWCVIEIIAINRREGAWTKPAAPPLKSELVTVAMGLVALAVFIFLHPYIAGVPIR